MAETITLDPAAVAHGRIALEITPWIAAAGPDWGDAEISAYMADQAVGSSPVDYRIPNRMIKIPLILTDQADAPFTEIRRHLQQKTARFQQEGGWIARTVDGTSLYADVVNATLHLGGSIFQAFRGFDTDAVLTLECRPDWYGDEISTDAVTGNPIASVLKSGGSNAVIQGDYPARCRILLSQSTANNWRISPTVSEAGTTTLTPHCGMRAGACMEPMVRCRAACTASRSPSASQHVCSRSGDRPIVRDGIPGPQRRVPCVRPRWLAKWVRQFQDAVAMVSGRR